MLGTRRRGATSTEGPFQSSHCGFAGRERVSTGQVTGTHARPSHHHSPSFEYCGGANCCCMLVACITLASRSVVVATGIRRHFPDHVPGVLVVAQALEAG